MAKFCTKCGTQLPDEANVCSSCGASVAADAKKVDFVGLIVDGIAKVLSLAAIVFLALGAVGFLYEFIFAIVDASDAYTHGFRVFLNGFQGAIALAAKYLFYTVVTVIGSKLIKK